MADQCVFIRGLRAKRVLFTIRVVGIDDSQIGGSSFKRSSFTVYQEQLSELSRGLALWNPNPQNKIYNRVSIGDVGYMHEGTFIRMFNVILPWNHPSNALLGNPEPYDFLDCGPFNNTIEARFDKVDYYSRFVTTETNASNLQAMSPDE